MSTVNGWLVNETQDLSSPIITTINGAAHLCRTSSPNLAVFIIHLYLTVNWELEAQ